MGFHSNFEGGGRGPLSKFSTFDTHTVLRMTIKIYCESFKSKAQLLKEEIRCKALGFIQSQPASQPARTKFTFEFRIRVSFENAQRLFLTQHKYAADLYIKRNFKLVGIKFSYVISFSRVYFKPPSTRCPFRPKTPTWSGFCEERLISVRPAVVPCPSAHLFDFHSKPIKYQHL